MTSSVRDACVPAFQRGVGRRVDECGRRCARDDDGMGWEKREKDARRGVWFSCVNGYDYQTRGGVLNARRS